MSGFMNPNNPLSPLNPIGQSIYYSTPTNGEPVVNSSPIEIISTTTVPEFDLSQVSSFIIGALPFIFAVMMLPFLFLVVTRLFEFFKDAITGGGYYTHSSPPEPKKQDKKPKEPIYKVPGGNGYYVKGYDGEETYVSLIDLYPEGTDIKQLLELKNYNQDGDK